MLRGYTDKNYLKYKSEWTRINDFIAGEKTVKENALSNKYILVPTGIKDKVKKQSFIDRGFFPELVETALDEATGRILQQTPKYPEVPETSFFDPENVTGSGVSLKEMINKVIDNLNSTTRCGILIDYSGSGNYYSNMIEQKLSGDKIIWSFYDELSIIAVKTNKRGIPVYIELAETVESEFSGLNTDFTEAEARRILFIDPVDNIYKQQLYIFNSEINDFQEEGELIIPLHNNIPFNEIPFVFFNGFENNHEVHKPRLLKMTETTNSIYQNWTDLEHIIYNICVPVRYGTGIIEEEASAINEAGPTSMFISANPDASFGVLDINGAGVVHCENNIQNKLKIAERLGYVFLDTGVKTATQSMLETTGRTITLQDVVTSCNNGINKCMELTFMWLGITFDPEKNSLILNIKSDDTAFEYNTLNALINSYKSGMTRKKDVHKFMLERKITDEQDFDKWSSDLDDEISEIVPEI